MTVENSQVYSLPFVSLDVLIAESTFGMKTTHSYFIIRLLTITNS
jgi:hypothetical protein